MGSIPILIINLVSEIFLQRIDYGLTFQRPEKAGDEIAWI